MEVGEERSREAHAGLLFKGFNWLWSVGSVRRESTKLKCQIGPFCCTGEIMRGRGARTVVRLGGAYAPKKRWKKH